MKKVIFIMFTLVLFTLSIVGCGIPVEEHTALLIEKDSLIGERNTLLTEKDALVGEREALIALRDALSLSLKNLESANKELEAQLNRKSLPPAHFIDRQELAVWRETTGIVHSAGNYVDDVLKLQRMALEDGKIISLDLDWDDTTEYWGLMLTVIAGDKFYTIYPDDLTITYFADVN